MSSGRSNVTALKMVKLTAALDVEITAAYFPFFLKCHSTKTLRLLKYAPVVE
ncbi:hypothetical protein SC499_21695 [Peribacillus simplex]|uniref:hypothetical protein n=1 Tax=Peribacillus simplex TaxID=1478 RepID=UPI00298EB875|nr:hypothetical protein [Peribacillus simplex]MDW7617218.1 hypothetical protein [Peribacillus simplex]